MSVKQTNILHASCVCGKVTFETSGKPIVSVECYCTSCREAGRGFEQLDHAPPLVNEDGGTALIVVRKDRVRCVKGADLLREHRLSPSSPTRRVVSLCCNSPMFLDFSKGHWLTMYRNRFIDETPSIEMRVMTGDREPGKKLSDDVPNHATHSWKLLIKILAAWVAMRFRRPEIAYGRTTGVNP